MKETKENIAMLKWLGFKLDDDGFYCDKNGWGFLIEYMPSFKTLMVRYAKHHYHNGYDDADGGAKRKYGKAQDR